MRSFERAGFRVQYIKAFFFFWTVFLYREYEGDIDLL